MIKEIKKMPCVAQWMYFLNCLFMDRGNVKQNLEIILKAIAQVKEGYSIYIAPEGTRNATDTLLEFKEGSKKMEKLEIIEKLKNENSELLKLMRLRMIEIKKVHKKGYLTEIEQAIEMISKLKLLENLSYNYFENEKFIALLEEN